ncbi:FAD-binding protein [Actinomadura sp. DC4]|uniref:FAD-binding protein n=1 Tax=Actinomadura sp. DC4 TaxID=3055069 RepID=UPI0025B1BE2A|nr:FAD-binding protein [Actinomadura sp. DC4]MDN3356942.1 FAD-binding protein [Actinomadura sp. DC4]
MRLDEAALDQSADDFGHLVHHRPWAVVEPGSVDDIATVVRHCQADGIPVAARGRGHGTFGQAQVAGGIAIDMASLRGIEVGADRAYVQAGVLWSGLLHATLPCGLAPPVLTDYLELSAGGTLASGGLGGTSHRYGAQADNVHELDVVTGTGERLTCSPRRHADLFHAALSGLGQCAIITRATVRLLPAPASVRRYRLSYPTLAALIMDQRTVVRDGRFDHVEGQVRPTGAGGWRYLLEAATFGGAADAGMPDVGIPDAGLLGDLSYTRGTEEVESLGYFDFLNRLAASVEDFTSIGEWARPHPWLNLLLPDSVTDGLVEDVLAHMTPADLGVSGVILLYPVRRRHLRTPLLRVPDEELAFLFALLKASSPGAEDPAAMVAANRTLYERARAAGGTQYPVGAVPMTHADWRRHFGAQWPRLETARRRYDPAGILTPGQGIF